MQELQRALKQSVKDLFNVDIEPELTRPEEQFGDYASNVAMQLAPKLGKPPREIAEALAGKLQSAEMVAKTEVAGPGFINFFLSDEALLNSLGRQPAKAYDGQTIVLEHTDPNPFKEFHIGHAYSNTVGVAIGRLLENAGAKVHQVSYHGDVGLHIAMAVWGIRNEIGDIATLDDDSFRQRLGVDIGFYYAKGVQAYQDNPQAKAEIENVNIHLYRRDDPNLNAIYDKGRSWSLGLFNEIYRRLNVEFEKPYFESETAQPGVDIVRKNLGKVFIESDGAVIYDGEKVGLHKRVFITKQELPTYEAKEIGLAFAKARDYPDADSFIVITANEIDDYFKVFLAAIKEIDSQLGSKIRHLSHGVVRFPEGKMSSRTGTAKLLSSLEADIESKARQLFKKGEITREIVFGAMKYEFLKHRIGSDFIFDIEESISLQGNSGPYLQYAYVRARSILQKSGNQSNLQPVTSHLEVDERSLARKIGEFPEVVEQATNELLPSHVCTYLYELAQNFNRFYEQNRILGDARQALRLKLVENYATALKDGLKLLNIQAVEKM